jgi:hypothetical protein
LVGEGRDEKGTGQWRRGGEWERVEGEERGKGEWIEGRDAKGEMIGGVGVKTE